MTKDVEAYFAQGCGRCPKGGTPACKVHTWAAELAILRDLVRETPLVETCKWGVPTYTLNGKNVLLITCFLDAACLSFFKGSLLSDPHGLLVAPGQNSQADRTLRFTSVADLQALEDPVRQYIQEAIELERQGKRVAFTASQTLDYPAELLEAFAADAALQQAFEALTPGRKRGYILHINAAKQPETRRNRIAAAVPAILAGKGLHDR